MALVNCPECHEKVSDLAPTCPKCGYPINEPARPPAAPPARVEITRIEFTRKWVKLLGALCGCGMLAGFLIVVFVPTLALNMGAGELVAWAIRMIGLLILVVAFVGSVIVALIRWWLHG